ncbi:Arm DNA-binding domain-containing protein [Syntrophomonas zehnderi]|uniref:Arm DNA-binding domain-containing protein n=1 Tax=Syntrophomonas zehnderi TaxID=404335 RepID=UPI000626B590|nr:Arm DNA-binding domain-containing protein [Syntrophomonas zehnderi]
MFIRYKTDEGYKTYGKRGFTSKTEAIQHEAEMQVKHRRPGYQAIMKAENKNGSACPLSQGGTPKPQGTFSAGEKTARQATEKEQGHGTVTP